MTKDLVKGGKLYLYGPVGGSWFDDSGFTDEDVIAALESMSGDITVHLNSPGGSVFQGVAIHTALAGYGGKVTIQVDALAASAASVIACAGDVVAMSPGAQIMVHDPENVTWGDADEHRRTAAQLDSIARSAAQTYADKTGLSVDECLALMKAETWMDAQSAIEKGFADEVLSRGGDADASMTADFPHFDYALFERAPAALMAISQPIDLNRRAQPEPVQTAVMTAQPKEPSMTKPNQPEPVKEAPKPAPAVVLMSADQVDEFAEEHGVTHVAQLRAIKKKSKTDNAEKDEFDPVMVRDAILDVQKKAQPGPVNSHPATVVADHRDKFRTGAALALMARAGLEGERNEFSGMDMLRMAEESLRVAGVTVPHSRDQIALAALTGGPIMAHSTSDFPAILADVANKSLLKGHEEVDDKIGQFTDDGSLTDFKEASRVDLSTIAALDQVAENGEYRDVTIGERKETIRLKKYGNKISITWETIVNDDLSVLSKVPLKMGRAARRTVGDVVFSVFTDNPKMADGVALFHSTHKNLATGAGSAMGEAGLAGLRLLMRKQKDGEAALNIRPHTLLVPVALEDEARSLVLSEFSPGETQRVPNKVRGFVSPENVIGDNRLDEDSAASYYITANPAMYDTIEVAFLDGRPEPQMFQREGFDRDGIELKIRHVFGVAPLSWRTMAKSAGA